MKAFIILFFSIFINIFAYSIPSHPLPKPNPVKSRDILTRVPEEVHYIDELKKLIAFHKGKKINNIYFNSIKKPSARKKIPTLWPVQGGGIITSPFGPRYSPFTGRQELHSGVDIAFGSGVPIIAAADGIVTNAETNKGYGVLVVLEHGYGFSTFYGHLMRSSVQEGDIVRKGQIIGYMGTTGRSRGVHLHFEVRINNIVVDPKWFMFIRSF